MSQTVPATLDKIGRVVQPGKIVRGVQHTSPYEPNGLHIASEWAVSREISSVPLRDCKLTVHNLKPRLDVPPWWLDGVNDRRVRIRFENLLKVPCRPWSTAEEHVDGS